MYLLNQTLELSPLAVDKLYVPVIVRVFAKGNKGYFTVCAIEAKFSNSPAIPFSFLKSLAVYLVEIVRH